MSAVCTHGCRWNPRGERDTVAPAARAHEALTGHRVHVTDGHTSLWPRPLWTPTTADESS